MYRIGLTIFFLCCSQFTFAQSTIEQQIAQLGWKEQPGSYAVASRDAEITLLPYQYLVLGQDANTYLKLVEGVDSFHVDAVMVNMVEQQQWSASFARQEIGYVKTDDWQQNMDPDAILSDIKQGTQEANKHRANGYAQLFVDGWAQKPYLDETKSIIYWAIKGHNSNQQQFINAKALKLGRKGYTEIVWAGSNETFTNAKEVLEPLIASYQYHDGAQYDDFMPGKDTVAALGAGALVYKLATGKVLAKAGIWAAAAIFAKKLWFIIALPFIYGWRWLKAKLSKSE